MTSDSNAGHDMLQGVGHQSLVKRSGFYLRSVCVGSVVYKVALDHVFASVVQLTPDAIRPPML
jgi:hypothetical protein